MNLKSIIFLLACGVECSLALSECSVQEIFTCNKEINKVKKVPETEEEMDDFCVIQQQAMNCEMDLIERCPNLKNFLQDNKETMKILMMICDKERPYRKLALKYATCLVENNTKYIDVCPSEYDVKDHSEMCDRLRKRLKCQEEEIVKRCGEDIRELYKLTLNSEYILQQKRCF